MGRCRSSALVELCGVQFGYVYEIHKNASAAVPTSVISPCVLRRMSDRSCERGLAYAL